MLLYSKCEKRNSKRTLSLIFGGNVTKGNVFCDDDDDNNNNNNKYIISKEVPAVNFLDA